jgi:predicted phosphoribosyltransferase
MVLNEPLVRELGLSTEEIEVLAEPVQAELQARNRIFRENRPWPELGGKIVILVDDGLASGYTMLAAVRVVRRHKASLIVVAVPTASVSTIKLVAPQVDAIICPNIRSGYSFAVADAYRNWYDLDRTEVIKLLKSQGLLAKK